MLREILENIELEKLLKQTKGISSIWEDNIPFNKIKKLSDEDKLELITKSLDRDSGYYNESNAIKVYSSLFYNLKDGKFSGKKQDIFTDSLGRKYIPELDVQTTVYDGKDLPNYLILYPKSKNADYDLIEIKLDNINKYLVYGYNFDDLD